MAQLYFYYSTMNAGKSTSLLQSAYNYVERGMYSAIFTAAIDDRTATGVVSSRIGLSQPADIFNSDTDLFQQISKIKENRALHCVLVDESQFLLKNQVQQLTDVVDKLNVPVMCYGIRTDFQGELFEGSKYLLSWADKLVELKTICHCGKKANMVVRYGEDGHVVSSGDQVEIGGNDKYMSLCRKHFKQAFETGQLTSTA
ncbi:thymidine kinase [Psychrosphaera sp. B3R10]|uniref:thymidine kinase n=1 Tax=unclassified Psychrosphaera TaxID=2641570 RepID=UPI001C098931|nr:MULTISPECIES: thymidine kinase [unclassified Psychrosphaera]MBU2882541.1 thymidine kinase [Psychrosphaera sp. I2R16]MBU2989441.1 thymidine kinase [Psychrosphaera sp. B3R10]